MQGLQPTPCRPTPHPQHDNKYINTKKSDFLHFEFYTCISEKDPFAKIVHQRTVVGLVLSVVLISKLFIKGQLLASCCLLYLFSSPHWLERNVLRLLLCLRYWELCCLSACIPAHSAAHEPHVSQHSYKFSQYVCFDSVMLQYQSVGTFVV